MGGKNSGLARGAQGHVEVQPMECTLAFFSVLSLTAVTLSITHTRQSDNVCVCVSERTR